jgi:hypothetical protein
MRRALVLSSLALLAAAPTALAVGRSSDDGTLSVKRGRGMVSMTLNGVAIGRVAHGRVTVTDVDGDGRGLDVWGCDRVPKTAPATGSDTSTCTGADLRFRAVGGKWKIVVRGSGMYLSVVGRGTVTLDGRGGFDATEDGVFSFNDDPYQSLPADAEDFLLAAPSGS